MNPHMGLVPATAFRLMFTKPIISSLMCEDSPAMGIDKDTLVIRPAFTGTKGMPLRPGRKQEHEQRNQQYGSFHIIQFLYIYG